MLTSVMAKSITTLSQGKNAFRTNITDPFIILYSLGTIKASQAVVLNEDSVVVTQRKLM